MKIGKVAAIFRFKLLEQRNEIAARPITVLLWLPRLALYAFTAFFTYRWLLSGTEVRFAAVLVVLPVLAFMLCLLAGSQKLFNAKENVVLIAAPLNAREFLLVKYAEVCAAVLEIALFGIAVVLAAGEAMSASIVLVSVSLLLSMLLGLLLSIPAALLLARMAAAIRKRAFLLVLAGLALACGILAIFLFIPESFPALSIQLLAWFWRHLVQVIACQAVMLCLAAVCCLKFAQAAYHSARSRLVEAEQTVRITGHRKSFMIGAPAVGSGFAILAKDTLVNLRNPMQWLRAILVLALLSLYPLLRGWLSGDLPEITMVVNVSFASLLGFVLIGEVVTNAFSAELNRIRIILAAPLPLWKVVAAKLCAYCLPMVFLCETAVLILDLAAGLPFLYTLCSVVLTAFVAVGTGALLTGVGTISAKPDRESQGGMDDFMAEQAFFTNPGSFLVFLLGSLALGLNLALVAAPVLLGSHWVSLGAAALPLTLFLALEMNAAIVVLSVLFGSRCLGRLAR